MGELFGEGKRVERAALDDGTKARYQGNRSSIFCGGDVSDTGPAIGLDAFEARGRDDLRIIACPDACPDAAWGPEQAVTGRSA